MQSGREASVMRVMRSLLRGGGSASTHPNTGTRRRPLFAQWGRKIARRRRTFLSAEWGVRS